MEIRWIEEWMRIRGRDEGRREEDSKAKRSAGGKY
jgi:hypothetical protein